jgi:hypothetical protein
MATVNVLKRVYPGRSWIVAGCGVLLGLLAWSVFTLDFRYALAIYGGLFALAVLAASLRHIDDILIYALVLHIPFSFFGKWLFMIDLVEEPNFFFARGVNVGGGEILLLLGYTIWAWRICVARTELPPRFSKIDFLVGLFIFAGILSLINAHSKLKGIFDVVYSAKSVLIYFYLSHKVRRHHLPGVVAMFSLAIVLEASLAGFEHFTGNVGIGKSKGDIAAAGFGEQYEIAGFEHARAEGTTLDSHALGLFFIMTLPIPFVLMGMQFVRLRLRLILAGVVVMGAMGVMVSFCRSSMISGTLSLGMAMAIMTLAWKQGKLIFVSLIALFLVAVVYPDLYRQSRERFVDAPSEIVTVRYDTYWTSWGIWKDHFLFGYGAGNYYDALDDPEVKTVGWTEIVHNSFLLVASETGLFGVVGYFGTVLAAMYLCLKQLRCQDLLVRSLSLALLTALLASLLQGMSDPLFKDPVDYALLWTHVGLCCALNRITVGATAPVAGVSSQGPAP